MKTPLLGCSAFGFLSVVLATAGLCLVPFGYMVSAPPVEKTVALIESSPAVAAVLGGPVDVSLVVTREFERDLIPYEGRDSVYLLTTASGSRGDAQVRLSAMNVDDQGWAGTFEVATRGTPVLVDGAYRTDSGGTILRGTFAPDGAPIVAP